MNHANPQIIEWFRKEYPDDMIHMEKLREFQGQTSCQPFTEGKKNRALFKQLRQNRYALLDAVSSDTTGPITSTDKGGNKFVQILVDACTGWSDVQLMKKKSEAGRAIIKSMNKIQALCNKKTKRLHTDGAKEEKKELREYLILNETTPTYTAPSSSQSNAFAERRFKKLIAETRTALSAASHMPKSLWLHETFDAADKRNYLARTKDGIMQPSPNKNIEVHCLTAKVSRSQPFLPWGTKNKAVSTKKIKK